VKFHKTIKSIVYRLWTSLFQLWKKILLCSTNCTWWLILCVNLTGPQDAQIKHSFWMCLWWLVFPDETSFWIGGLSSIMWVGTIQCEDSLPRLKGRGGKTCLLCLPHYLTWDISSPAFGLLYHQLPWCSGLQILPNIAPVFLGLQLADEFPFTYRRKDTDIDIAKRLLLWRIRSNSLCQALMKLFIKKKC
jgi:hypothetical protein